MNIVCRQINMKKCTGCDSYFAEYLIVNNKCKGCSVTVPKQEIAEQNSAKEDTQAVSG